MDERFGKNNPNWKGGKNISCKYCGKIFWIAPWRIKRNARFCSSSCWSKTRVGSLNSCYRGGRIIYPKGYMAILKPEHPRSHNGHVLEHIVIAERVLGKPLPKGAVVHHVDGNGKNNLTDNLIIFQNNKEHLQFHARERRL